MIKKWRHCIYTSQRVIYCQTLTEISRITWSHPRPTERVKGVACRLRFYASLLRSEFNLRLFLLRRTTACAPKTHIWRKSGDVVRATKSAEGSCWAEWIWIKRLHHFKPAFRHWCFPKLTRSNLFLTSWPNQILATASSRHKDFSRFILSTTIS